MYRVGTPLKKAGFTRRIVASRSARSRGFGTSAIGLPLTNAESLDADVRVDMKERQRREDHVALAAEHRPGPGLDLEARDHVRRVIAEHALGRAGGAAAHEQHGRIVRGHARLAVWRQARHALRNRRRKSWSPAATATRSPSRRSRAIVNSHRSSGGK